MTECADFEEIKGDLSYWLLDNGVDPRQTKEAVLDQVVGKYIWYRSVPKLLSNPGLRLAEKGICICILCLTMH